MADRCASNGLRPLRNPGTFISFHEIGGHSVLDFQASFIHSSFAPPLKVPAHESRIGFPAIKLQSLTAFGVLCSLLN